MNTLKVLLVSPNVYYLKAIQRAAGVVEKPKVLKVSGIGSISLIGNKGLGLISMQVKGDYKKMCDRMEKAWIKFTSLDRMGVILPGFTEEWMRNNNYYVRFTMYFLNDRTAVEQFVSPAIIWKDTNTLEDIFKVSGPPKKRRKKNHPSLLTKKALVAREIPVEEAEREEDTCVVCFENKITHMCVPCSHYVLCGLCAIQIQTDKPVCPVCRNEIASFATPIGK